MTAPDDDYQRRMDEQAEHERAATRSLREQLTTLIATLVEVEQLALELNHRGLAVWARSTIGAAEIARACR